MKKLQVNKDTTLSFDESDNHVELSMSDGSSYHFFATVSLEELEKWLASIREQIITSSKGQAETWKCPKCEMVNDAWRDKCNGCWHASPLT